MGWIPGSHATITGGSSAMKARPQPIIAWLAHSISWVLMTPLGWPVEPEVNRILAMVSGAILACAASTAGVGCTLVNSEKSVAGRSPGGFVVTATSMPGGTAAAMARAKAV